MDKYKSGSINFFSILLIAFIFAMIIVAKKYGGLSLLPIIMTNPTTLGEVIGRSMGMFFGSFIFAIVINFFINLARRIFKKEKKTFSYILVWFFVILFIIAGLVEK